jgi:hypothetical protein
MTPAAGPKSVFTTPEFERWWEARGSEVAAAGGLEPAAARVFVGLARVAGRARAPE